MGMNDFEAALWSLIANDYVVRSLVASQSTDVDESGGPGVFEGMAPEGAAFPFVYFFWSGGGADRRTRDGAWGTELYYTIRASSVGTDARVAEQLNERIYELVTHQPLDAASFHASPGQRVALASAPELSEGVQYRHRGSRYLWIVVFQT